MPHAYTAVMNGRDIYRFLDIPKELVTYDRGFKKFGSHVSIPIEVLP